MIGRRYGNYRALSLLGEGGMGAVYLAEHPEIGRKVAVKVLRADLGRDPSLLGRFLNEARAANAIRHPNIIEILDSGITPEGQSYLVMELLEGETVATRLGRLGRLATTDALDVAGQTASAVGAAHGKGIIHRDLKPDNLFLIPSETEAGRDRVKVLDFGIAKLQGPTSPGDAVKTRTGTLMGTPVYMSPEQCLGTKEVDQRSDIYSLGVILFEMVCGKPPFYSTGFGELVNMHINHPPPAPRGLNPTLPPNIEAMILWMLAKRPEERPQQMAGVHDALKSARLELGARITPTPPPHTSTLSAVGPTQMQSESRRTTFTLSSGEAASPAGRPIGRWLAVAGAALGAAVVVVVLATDKSVTPPVAPPVARPAAPAPVPPVSSVSIDIETEPSGAQVFRASDNTLLGTTPWHGTFPKGGPALDVRIEKEGFTPATLSLSLERDWRERRPLEPRPAEPRPKRPRRPADDEPAKL